MESEARNLHSLKIEFRDGGMPAKGYKIVSGMIKKNKTAELAHLLRDHITETVYSEELDKRFEIDSLIEYYNLLLIAALAGYVPASLDPETCSEIKEVLSHKSVKPYYQKYYPYKLTEYTLAYVDRNKFVTQPAPGDTIGPLTEFISLNRMLRNDEDIKVFLNMLDHVSYGGDDFSDVAEILSSYERLSKVITARKRTEEIAGVWGFFKYTTFLSQFNCLLASVSDNPLLQSGMWLFHGYFLDRMNAKMKNLFKQAFVNIEKALASPDIFQNIAREVYGQNIPDDFDETELRQTAAAIVEQSKKDVDNVLSPKWKAAMEQYFAN
jgi:hypothetical protein